MPYLETDCENVSRTSTKHWRKKSNLPKCVRMRHSLIESPLECATRPLQTQMMVLKIELQHGESIHTLVLSPIPELKPHFQDEQLDQFFKFISYSFLALMKLKFRFHLRQRQIEILGR